MSVHGFVCVCACAGGWVSGCVGGCVCCEYQLLLWSALHLFGESKKEGNQSQFVRDMMEPKSNQNLEHTGRDG